MPYICPAVRRACVHVCVCVCVTHVGHRGCAPDGPSAFVKYLLHRVRSISSRVDLANPLLLRITSRTHSLQRSGDTRKPRGLCCHRARPSSFSAPLRWHCHPRPLSSPATQRALCSVSSLGAPGSGSVAGHSQLLLVPSN